MLPSLKTVHGESDVLGIGVLMVVLTVGVNRGGHSSLHLMVFSRPLSVNTKTLQGLVIPIPHDLFLLPQALSKGKSEQQ